MRGQSLRLPDLFVAAPAFSAQPKKDYELQERCGKLAAEVFEREYVRAMIEAIKNAVGLAIFCAPVAAVLTWGAWSSGESMLFVLLFLGVLSAIWVLGYLSERAAARKLGRLHDEEGVWRGFIQLFLTLCAMTALGVIGLYAFW